MDIVRQPIVDGVTLADIANNPSNYPEELICVAIDLISDFSKQLRDAKENITANLIHRMRDDNATKRVFQTADGTRKIATLKKGALKLNTDIKNYEAFIKKSGFHPQQLGEYKFVPFGWSTIKEIRKQGGKIQALCDELYPEGKPTLEIK